MSHPHAALLPHNVQSITRKVDPSRKRKREEDAAVQNRRERIVITDASSKLPTQSLEVACVITRAQLPLSFLDPTTLLCGRFQTSTAIEELAAGPGALLLCKDSDGTYYAVEKICDAQYALCRLAAHVTKTVVEGLKVSRVGTERSSEEQTAPHTTDWRAIAAIPAPNKPIQERPRKAPRLSMTMQPVQEEPMQDAVIDSIEQSQEPQESQQETPDIAQDILADSVMEPLVPLDEAFTLFIQHYLDMLYKSRTSVAYFAKAHVSRLKASLRLDDEEGKVKLRDFLEGLLLSSTIADKKHKKIWPEKILDIGPSLSVADMTEGLANKKSKRSKTKHKLDKKGLLAGEEDCFVHWWIHDDDAGTAAETREARLKRRSLQLRTREAFLQVIVMLELISMSAQLKPAEADKTDGSRSRDHTVALDLLLDKLCIWHSLESGAGLGLEPETEVDGPKKAPDQLPEFCVEVIVPFYMSRMPEQASAVNKKLGGPTAVSPAARHKNNPFDSHKSSKKSKTTSHRSSHDKRPKLGTDKPNLPRPTIEALRVKRESSEVSFDSVPLAPTTRANNNARSSSVLDRLKMRSREVDFDVLSQAQEQRRKKQADVDSKLKEAIQGLKRPNRGLAGKELADVAEQRQRMAQARERALKSQKARQKAAVQVDATPKHSRIRTDIAVTPEARRHTQPATDASASTVSMIPSSGIRAASPARDEDSVPHTGHRNRQQDIAATPVRAIKFAMPAIPESALRPPPPAPFLTPVKTKPVAVRSIEQTPVQATPVRASSGPAEEIQETPQGAGDSRSIYEALGWDD